MFQCFFNDIINFSIQWVLTLEIVLWRFGNPSRLQFPKWKLIWECGGSFPHTFHTLGSVKCDSQASFLACTFASPCLGHEPKARVATLIKYASPMRILPKNNLPTSFLWVWCKKKLVTYEGEKERMHLKWGSKKKNS